MSVWFARWARAIEGARLSIYRGVTTGIVVTVSSPVVATGRQWPMFLFANAALN